MWPKCQELGWKSAFNFHLSNKWYFVKPVCVCIYEDESMLQRGSWKAVYHLKSLIPFDAAAVVHNHGSWFLFSPNVNIPKPM